MGSMIGVDIGQKRDPTANCVAEVEVRGNDLKTEQHYMVQHLGWLPLGTALTHAVSRIDDIGRRVWQKTYGAFKIGSHHDLVTALGMAVHAKPLTTPTSRSRV